MDCLVEIYLIRNGYSNLELVVQTYVQLEHPKRNQIRIMATAVSMKTSGGSHFSRQMNKASRTRPLYSLPPRPLRVHHSEKRDSKHA